MASPLHLSDAASLGLHTMALLAKAEEERFSTHRIAQILEVSEHHLAKVIARLAKAGLVDAARGPSGGTRLARPAEEITVLEVYEALEGSMRPAGCLLGKPACDGACVFSGLFGEVHQMVRDFFAGTTLAGLAGRVTFGGASWRNEA